MIKKYTGDFSLDNVTYLSLKQLQLHSYGDVVFCGGLQEIDLSGNQLTCINPLAPLLDLKILNLSSNHITSLQGIEPLIQLRNFDVRDNYIASIDMLKPLLLLPQLTSVALQGIGGQLPNPGKILRIITIINIIFYMIF